MAVIEAVLFDCDGTLVDSEKLAASLLVELLGGFGIALGLSEVLRLVRGVKFEAFLAGLCGRYPQLDAESVRHDYRERSLLLFRQHLEPMPGALEFVHGLALKKAVASNGPRAKIETCLTSVGLLESFEGHIVSAYEVGSWKPEPGLILHAAERLGVKPERCLLIDDSLQGIEAGLAAGARVLGFDPGGLLDPASCPVPIIGHMMAAQAYLEA